ncbi:helix-turn-helix domain-containing protein [Nocardia ignorata]|uniref:Zn-dependent peptidase ImmA (M78 family) n=1 Tax=Nocardia ignorata TaxID=145285 RepID=A0A4V3CMV0_NOCIG|nr:XRE family transcriptional regulator [Nocardia ignorata]TDP31542.1 Zn-dependent peptidase ImmA (M78 family) [Nocardia ignorata]
MGDVILTARRAAGMTQEELAEQLGIQQATLSRYENNTRTPEPDMVARLAAALSLTPEFLSSSFSRMQGALAGDVHMRRQRTAKVSHWKSGEARLNMYRMRSAFLLDRIGMRPQNQVPTFELDTAATATPADAARLTRSQWRMPIGPVRNLTRWLESAGVLIFEEDFDTHRIDGMSQWASDYPVIIVNAAQTTDRRRWTLAHELGHLVLHSVFVVDDREMERQADEFAAEFLMPKHLIEPDLSVLKPARLIDLKATWGVSMQAIYERAYQFGRVTGEERTRFYRSLNARGWKANEPGADRIPPEHPALAATIGEALLDKGLDRQEVLAMTGSSGDADHDQFIPARVGGLKLIR